MLKLRSAIVLLAAIAAAMLTARLGLWQLDRAAQKTALQQTLQQQRALPHLLQAQLAREAADVPAQLHRIVRLQGRWLAAHTVFLENRQMNGQPGFYAVTPLQLNDGSAVLVQRGWVPRDLMDRTRVVAPPPPDGVVQVAGRIAPGPARLPHLRDTTYRHLLTKVEAAIDPQPHDPWPCHHQHFGASLAVTCQAYLRAGRLPVVRYLEDDALVQALQRIDARVRKSPAVRVYTSARLQGRVEVGLSWQLQQWANQNEMGGSQQVEDPLLSITRFRLRRNLRQAWQQRQKPLDMTRLAPLAQQIGVSTNWLQTQLTGCLYFGHYWELAHNQFSATISKAKPATVSITDAIAELRTWLRG